MMFYRFFAYIRFLGTSTNQHGVHSPFIYKYVTQCLYSRWDKTASKTFTVLLKSISYFKPAHIFIDTSATDVLKKVAKQHPTIQVGKSPYDLVYFSNLENSLLHEVIHGPHIHNDTMILIHGLYNSKASAVLWKKIKDWDKVTVSVDLFYCGVIFVRRDQVKEHFKIRI